MKVMTNNIVNKRNNIMNSIKKKIILAVFFFIGIMTITNNVYASDVRITVTNETNRYIEGTIESTLEEDESLTEASSGTISQNIDPNKFYYSQLKNALSRNVYNSLKKDTTGIGSTKVNFSNQIFNINVTSFYNDQTYANNTINKQIKGYIYDAIVAFNDDNPIIYWYYAPKTNLYYKIDKVKKQIVYNSVTISSIISERSDYKRFNQKLDEVLNSINGTSTYEIVKKCHDYICNTVVYTKKENTDIDQTAYDALINKEGVCDAEARLFQLLCNEKGVKCIRINGYAGDTEAKGAHAWNYVYHPDEKKWYAIDTTWDNHKTSGKAPTYSYFLDGKNTLIKISNGTIKFSENHIAGGKNYEIQTYIPNEPELAEEAYEKFSGTMKKSTANKTNQPVTMTITFNRELKEIPKGWNLSEDRKVVKKIYSENTEEKISFFNVRGEKLNANINITNIDKIAPEAVVSYSSTNKTNQNVKVTVTGNEKLQYLSGWNQSQDKKTLTKIYRANQKEDITIKDIAGNIRTIPIEINNIDKSKPLLLITYNLSEINNNRVLVTIEGNEELQEIDGWTTSEDKKKISKIYTENVLEEIQIKDLVGNAINKKIQINTIGNYNENNIVQYSLKDTPDGRVEATIISNKELKPKEEWELSEDKKVLTKIYTEDTSEEVSIVDIDGNVLNLIMNSNNNTEDFLTNVIYSNEEKTNKDVQVSIVSNKELQELDGWSLSLDKKLLIKLYTDNIKEDIIIKDISSNEKNETIEINNIDKEPPILQIKYSDVNENGEIMVTITSNEELDEKYNWSLSENKKSISRLYDTAIEDDILIEDLAGNEQTIKVKISEMQLKPVEDNNITNDTKHANIGENIEEDDKKNIDININNNSNNNNYNNNVPITTIKNTNTNSSTDEKNDSIVEVENASTQVIKKQSDEQKTANPKMVLPNTGFYINFVYIVISIFVVTGIISFLRYIKYRGIDK